MTAPTQPVTVRLADFGGPAVAGVTVKARLSDVDYTADGTFVSTDTVSGVTDASGVAVLNVFPNAVGSGLGTRGTTVLFHASMIGSRSLKVEARVPNTPCNLTDILVPLGDVPLTEAELALMQVQASEALAQNWASSVSAPVADGLFSAREYAAGSQSGTGGSAKDWATKLGTAVSGGEFSAKFHAQAAGTSETNAAASRAAIDNRLYPGSASVDPTTRPDGTASQVGDGYFNSGIKAFKYWDGVQWGSYTSSAAAFAAAAAASAAAATAVVTGGTGSLTPAAGKLPLADGSGNIDPLWLKSSPRSRAFGKIGSKLSKALTGKVRIAHAGTSIAAFQSSPGFVWSTQVQRVFGDSGDRINYLTFIGGTAQNAAYNGWDKLTFGGPQFSRLRGKSTSTAFDIFTSRCRFVAVRYSTETDGGSWSVSLNGGAPQAINSAGAQSYRNEVVLDAGFDGIHKLTVTPPVVAGTFAHFEAYECRTSDNGVFVDNSALGGTAAANMLIGYSPNNSGGVTTIPPVGFNGVDAHVNPVTKPDIFLWQFTVNDVGDGSAHFVTDYQSIMDRVVTQCRLNDIPIVLIIEPFGHLAFTITAESQGARDNAVAIRNYQLRVAADNEHVYVVDWHALTFINDIVRYTSVFYPVVVLSGGNTAYTGDFIHPTQPTGYAPATMALCAATGIPMPTSAMFSTIRTDQHQEAYPGASPLAVSAPSTRVNGKGTKKKITDQFGASHVVTEIGRALTLQGDINKLNAVPVFYSDTMVSAQVGGYTGAPANSDVWGAYYVDSVNGGGNLQLPTGYNGFFTITALMSPLTGTTVATQLILADSGFDAYMPNGQKVNVPAGASPGLVKNDWDVAGVGGQPMLHSVTFKRGASVSDAPGIRLTGRVYAVWLTFTPFAVTTERTRGAGAPSELAMPIYRNGDVLHDQVIPGQEIIETINGKDVKKIALATTVIKINAPTARYRAFRSKLETSIEILKATPEFIGTTLAAGGVLDGGYGGLVFSIGTARRHLFPALATSYAANYQGKTFTLMMRLAAGGGSLKFGLLGAGNFGMFASLDGGGNVVWAEFASGNTPATVGDTLTAMDPAWVYRNLAFTFTFPALTANMGAGGAGTITPFAFLSSAANSPYSYLVDGSSFLL